MKFSAKAQRWLKFVHLLGCSCWIGGAFSLLSLHLLRLEGVTVQGELFGIDRAAHAIDMDIVVFLGAGLCFVTGFLYSACTNWGFFRHKWIVGKWLITLFGILFGTVALGPWEQNMLALSGAGGAFSDAFYQHFAQRNGYFGLLQGALLVFAVALSVLKPWSGSKKPL